MSTAKPLARGGINSVRPMFTAGPWTAERMPGTTSIVSGAKLVAFVSHVKIDPYEANAALIANAPALFALAQQYASECAECAGVGVTLEGIDCDQCKDIREVIANSVPQ